MGKYSVDNVLVDCPAGLDPLWSDYNIRLIRLGDIMLLYAECMAQLNPANVSPADPNSEIYRVDLIRTRANKPMDDQANLLSARPGVNGQLPTATALMAAKGWRKEDRLHWKNGADFVQYKPGWTGYQSLIIPVPQTEVDRNPYFAE